MGSFICLTPTPVNYDKSGERSLADIITIKIATFTISLQKTSNIMLCTSQPLKALSFTAYHLKLSLLSQSSTLISLQLNLRTPFTKPLRSCVQSSHCRQPQLTSTFHLPIAQLLQKIFRERVYSFRTELNNA